MEEIIPNKQSMLIAPMLLLISAFVVYIVLFPPKPETDDFNWTQESTQADWDVSLPGEEGLAPQPLADLHAYVTLRKTKKVQSLLIVRNGKLVFEQYYPVRSSKDGTPMPVYFPPAPDTFHQMRSITKTVTSTLIGNLLFKGKLESKDVQLFSYYQSENYPDAEQKKAITLENALDFNSGFDWKEWGEIDSDAMKMWLSRDPYEYILNKGVSGSPGEHYVYQGAMSVLLGGVVEQVTGMTLREYAEDALFGPLGITNYDWFSHEITGDYLGSSGLYLRSRDLAKLGVLYLNEGMWRGERIFSTAWAEESRVPKGKFWKDKTIQYGHNWWFPLIAANGKTLDIAGMRGSGGQEMFIVPELNLVFVMTSGAYIGQDENFPFELLVDYVLPSVGIPDSRYIPKTDDAEKSGLLY
ncbi:beta-lactamase family protein [Parasalinivibrio latis]|uniref:serine hydrolase domain-containing protein n=1 Tax=Parasalinivibrio latis TaxID=2952610 RepID=UPI0030E20182